MKKINIINGLMVVVIAACLCLNLSYASTPLWSIVPLTSTSIQINSTTNATIQYRVTNNASSMHSLTMTAIPGITQVTSPGNCSDPFTLDSQQSCILTLAISGSVLHTNVSGGPKLCRESNPLQCYQPSQGNTLSISQVSSANEGILITNISNLALSVTGHTEYGIPGTPSSGTARSIGVTNVGGNSVTGLSISAPNLPRATTSSTSCNGTLPAGQTCVITITPGFVPTSNSNTSEQLCVQGTAPLPGIITINADNAASIQASVVVLDYGCLFQGGYVFSFDDTTSNTSSVGGKVVTTSDQTAGQGIIWSANSSGGYDGGVSIYGIALTSTQVAPVPNTNFIPGQASCNGANDGNCDSSNLLTYYSAINAQYYAAGLCQQTITGYSDWYLPAICEMGYNRQTGAQNICLTGNNPVLQNIQSNLIEYLTLNLFSGHFWSSTEDYINTQSNSLTQFYGNYNNSVYTVESKNLPYSVICVRALNP